PTPRARCGPRGAAVGRAQRARQSRRPPSGSRHRSWRLGLLPVAPRSLRGDFVVLAAVAALEGRELARHDVLLERLELLEIGVSRAHLVARLLDEPMRLSHVLREREAPIRRALSKRLELAELSGRDVLSGELGALLGRAGEPPFFFGERSLGHEGDVPRAGELRLRLVEAALSKVDELLDAFLSRTHARGHFFANERSRANNRLRVSGNALRSVPRWRRNASICGAAAQARSMRGSL